MNPGELGNQDAHMLASNRVEEHTYQKSEEHPKCPKTLYLKA